MSEPVTLAGEAAAASPETAAADPEAAAVVPEIDLVSPAAAAVGSEALAISSETSPTSAAIPTGVLVADGVAAHSKYVVEDAYAAHDPIEVESIHDRLLRRLIGARWLLVRSDPSNTMLWYGTALIMILAALLRFACLGRPSTLVFDETYYVKDAWTLWNLGYESRWPDDPNPAFEAGDVYSFTDEASYIVHPAVGKWLIALGMWLGGGATDPASWRLANALVGLLAVFLMIRIGRRLFRSNWMGLLAGLLMAVDGQAIVHSRTALLDQFVMIFALIAFGALLIDRDNAREKLAAGYVRVGPRPWRWVAGIALGLCCGVKWSGIFFVAAFGILTVIWDFTARYQVHKDVESIPENAEWVPENSVVQLAPADDDGSWSRYTSLTASTRPTNDAPPLHIADESYAEQTRAGLPKYLSQAYNWWARAFWFDAVPAFISLVPVAFLTYVASWFSWIRTPGAFMRQWAVDSRAAGDPNPGISWLPDSLNSLQQYHRMQWNFHVNLESPHPYQSTPDSWLVQFRPTAFYWDRGAEVPGGCGDLGDCVAAVIGIGNPLLWWLAAFSIVLTIGLGIMYRDWRALAVLSGLVGGWLPWFMYWNRTIFAFYSIAFTPWVILTLCYPAAVALERTEWNPRYHKFVWRFIIVVLALILLVSAAFYPMWSAYRIPYDWWQFMMWLPSWI